LQALGFFMVMTYTSLYNQIQSYVNRSNDTSFNAQIDYFIGQAQQRICRESANIGLETYVTGTFTSGVSVYPKPADWRRTLSINYGTGGSPIADSNTRNPILLRSYEFCRSYWPNDTESDLPLYYCDYGYSNILVCPTPDQDYPFEICYLAIPEQLSDSVSTNWLTNYAPDVLLYACLLEAMAFLKNDDRIQVWSGLYDKGLQSLNQQDVLRKTDRSSDRDSD
jgi:hypothetical protein